MHVIKFHNFCLRRQVHEAVRIRRTEAEIILNSKSEFHEAPVVGVFATTVLQKEHTTSASQGLGSSLSTRLAGRGGVRGRGGGQGGSQGGRRRRVGE